MGLSMNSRNAERRIPLLLDCAPASKGCSFNLTQGLPFADGELERGAPVRVVDADGTAYPTQGQTLATWRPDGRHVKWLLIDAQLPGRLLMDSQNIFLEYGPGVETVPPDDPVRIEYFDEDMGRPATMRNEHLCLRFRDMIQDPNPNFLTAVEVNGEKGWQDLLSGRSGPVLYAIDGNGHGCDSLSGAPAPHIEVEERGPIRSSICVRGIHADKDGRQLLPYILRFHLFCGSGRLRVFHTFVFDQNPDRFKLAAIGLRIPLNLGEQLKMAFGGESAPCRAESWRHATWLQEDDRNYRVEIEGQPFTSGSTTRGWAKLSGSRGSAVVVLRDAWQEHPKGIALDQDGTMDLQLLPSGVGRLLDLEVPWKEGFIHCSAEPARTEEELLNAMAKRPTAGVNLKGYYGSSAMPEGSAEGDMQSVRDAKAFAEKHLQGHRYVVGDVGFTGRATGLAKTHEFWLDVRPEAVDDRAAEQWAAFVQTPPIAPPEPEYTCGTGVLRIMHPRDVERFGEVEKGLEAMFDNLLDGPVAVDRLYGMIDYGDLLNAHGRAHGYTYRVFKDDPNVKITDLIGWFNNECFDNNYTQWSNFLRTGERKYWRLAEAYSEHLEDVDTIHVDPLHPGSVGLTHYHNILHWSANPSPSHTQIQGWLTHYFVTGNRRALEVAREAAENALRCQEPAGMVSNRHGVLRREYTAPMGNLCLFYQTTWEEKFGDCARRSLDVFLEAQLESGHWTRDIFTGGERGDEITITEDMEELRGWLLEPHVLYDVYKLTGDARIKRAVLAAGDALVEEHRVFEPTDRARLIGDTYMISSKPALMWLAFASELSNDPKYLPPIREFLTELPAMAKAWAAFDKWVPLQMVGFMPRYAAVAMAAMVKGAPES